PVFRQVFTSCWYNTSLGQITVGGDPYFVAKGDYIAGKFTNLNSSQQLRPTPYLETFLEIRRRSSKPSYTRFTYNPIVQTSHSITGTVTHTLNSTDTFDIVYSNGNAVIE